MRRAEIVAAILLAVVLWITFLVPQMGAIGFIKTFYYGFKYG